MKLLWAILVIGLAAVGSKGQDLEEPLTLYSELTGRTLLMGSGIPRVSDLAISRTEALANTNRTVTWIVSELAREDLQIVPDGELFAKVFYPASRWSNSPGAAYIASIRRPSASDGQEEQRNAMVNLNGVDVAQVINLYSHLRERVVLHSMLPNIPIHLRLARPLTKEEVTYAMHVVLGLNGVATVDDGDHFVQMVMIPALSLVKTNAPKPQADAPLLDILKVLPADAEDAPPPVRPGYGAPSVSPLGPMPRVERLVKLYANLTDKEAVPSEGLGGIRMPFEVEFPLTKEELLYAVERTLALNNMAITSAGEKTIRARPAAGTTKPRN